MIDKALVTVPEIYEPDYLEAVFVIGTIITVDIPNGAITVDIPDGTITADIPDGTVTVEVE